MYVSFNLVNRDPRGKERSQTIGSPLATEEAKLDAKTFDLNKMGSRDDDRDSGYNIFPEDNQRGLTAVFDEIRAVETRQTTTHRRNEMQKSASKAEIEEEMDLAAEEAIKPIVYGPKKTDSSAKKANVATPAMGDVGKTGAGGQSYTQLFQAQAQRRRGTQKDDLSPAAAFFAPDEESQPEPDVPPPPQVKKAPLQDPGPSRLPQFPPAGRGGPSQAPPVPPSAKDAGVRAWLAQASNGDSDDEVPTATPIPADVAPVMAKSASQSDVGSSRKSEIGSLKKSEIEKILGKNRGSTGSSGDLGPIFNRAKQGQGIYTGQFEQLSSDGRIPAFPSSSREQEVKVDPVEVDAFPRFLKSKASSTKMKYTDQFNEGKVPKFPSIQKDPPRVPEEIVPPKPKKCCVIL